MQIRQDLIFLIKSNHDVVPEIIELDNGVIQSLVFRNTYDFMIILE